MNAPIAHPPPVDGLARIGPKSVLQLIPLLDENLGEEERRRLIKLSGLRQLPADEGLMEETPAAMLHQALRSEHPALAPRLTRIAGERTADYLIAKRIPVAALRVMRHLPAWLAAPLLASVIEKHAWTFAGSGSFRVRSKQPLVLELTDNPVVRGEHSVEPLCHWHAAIFERLFRRIVDPHMRCVETQCCASGAKTCRFEIS